MIDVPNDIQIGCDWPGIQGRELVIGAQAGNIGRATRLDRADPNLALRIIAQRNAPGWPVPRPLYSFPNALGGSWSGTIPAGGDGGVGC